MQYTIRAAKPIEEIPGSWLTSLPATNPHRRPWSARAQASPAMAIACAVSAPAPVIVAAPDTVPLTVSRPVADIITGACSLMALKASRIGGHRIASLFPCPCAIPRSCPHRRMAPSARALVDEHLQEPDARRRHILSISPLSLSKPGGNSPMRHTDHPRWSDMPANVAERRGRPRTQRATPTARTYSNSTAHGRPPRTSPGHRSTCQNHPLPASSFG